MDIVAIDVLTGLSRIVNIGIHDTVRDVVKLISQEFGYEGIGIEHAGEEIKPSDSLFVNTGIMPYEEVIVTQSWTEELQKARSGIPLRELPDWTRSIQPIVVECVSRDGDALQYASADLRANPQLVLIAVKQKGTSLKYASPDLRNNQSIVLEAIRQEGESFYHASDSMKREEMVISEARWSGIMICV